MPEPSKSAFTISVKFESQHQLDLILAVFQDFCKNQDIPKKKYGYVKTDHNTAMLFLSPDGDKDVADLISLGRELMAILQTPLT